MMGGAGSGRWRFIIQKGPFSVIKPLLIGAGTSISAGLEKEDMTKEELLEFEGVVVDVLPDARFRVKLDNGHEIIAYTAGRMKRFRIRTLVGDRVSVEMTPYDLEKGRIVYRHKDERAPATRGQARRNFNRRR